MVPDVTFIPHREWGQPLCRAVCVLQVLRMGILWPETLDGWAVTWSCHDVLLCPVAVPCPKTSTGVGTRAAVVEKWG